MSDDLYVVAVAGGQPRRILGPLGSERFCLEHRWKAPDGDYGAPKPEASDVAVSIGWRRAV